MPMFSIRTNVIKRQARQLERDARRYEPLLRELDAVLAWLRHQDFQQKDELFHVLRIEQNRLERQKEQMRMLAMALYRICDFYEDTDERIVWLDDNRRKRNFRTQNWGYRTFYAVTDVLGAVGVGQILQ